MKITFNAPIILVFSFICVAVYFLNPWANSTNDPFVLISEWNFSSLKWYFRLFSNAVGHSNADHLMGNLAFILLLGPIVEEKYGSKKMIIMLFSTALACSLIHISFSNSGLLGASGIVFMLILLVSLVNFKSNEIPLTFILIVIVYIGKEVLGTFEDDNISHSTHIVGGIVGAVFGFMLTKKSGGSRTRNKNNPTNILKGL